MRFPQIKFHFLAYLVIGSAFLIAGVTPGIAQGPVVVTADQPNVWTLEQAHYLLAQMHRRNLDLKAEKLGSLDANDINGTRVDALRTLLDVSAEFDEAAAFRNRQVKGDTRFNSNRRAALIEQRDKLNEESLSLTRQIAALKINRTKTTDETSQAAIDAQIAELEIVKAAVDAQVEQKTSEINSLSSAGTFITPSPGPASTTNKASSAYEGALTDAVKEVTKQFTSAPQLNASLRLDNYLQMQYEILSKQLTLLRDEVGPGERLIFLEMPQSINTSYDKADSKWVQSWWKVSGYARCIAYRAPAGSDFTLPCTKVKGAGNRFASESDPQTTTWEIIRNLDSAAELARFENSLRVNSNDINLRQDVSRAENLKHDYSDAASVELAYPAFEISHLISPESNSALAIDLSSYLAIQLATEIANYNTQRNLMVTACSVTPRVPADCLREKQTLRGRKDTLKARIVSALNAFLDNTALSALSDWTLISPRVDAIPADVPRSSRVFRRFALSELLDLRMPKSTALDVREQTAFPISLGGKNVDISDRSIRIIDMFPKQSSINVNELKIESNAFSFRFLAKLLSGFGGAVGYERNRERYSQFVQQELYSSSFGKGSTEFGWTFKPMPGTKRVLSGTKTTYAIMIIPDDISAVIMRSKGAYFSRSATEPREFDDDMWLQGHGEDKRGWAGGEKTFVIPIPDGGSLNNNDFFVTSMRYRPVKLGERVVVSIYGRNFSSQTGVIVNGVPLLQSLGLAQPFILDDSDTSKTFAASLGTNLPPVKGSFERVDSNQILLTFEVPKEFEGQPVITLVAPGRALDLSSITININGNRTRLEDAVYMFGKRPTTNTTPSVTTTNVYKESNSTLVAVITGDNLNTVTEVLANGIVVYSRPTPPPVRANRIIVSGIVARDDAEYLHLTLLADSSVKQPAPIANPLYVKPPTPPSAIEDKSALLRIESVKLVDRVDDAAGNATIVSELTGSGFTDQLVLVQSDGVTPITNGQLIVVSPTRAFVRISIPINQLPYVVTMYSTAGKLKASGIITGKPEMVVEEDDEEESAGGKKRSRRDPSGPLRP